MCNKLINVTVRMGAIPVTKHTHFETEIVFVTTEQVSDRFTSPLISSSETWLGLVEGLGFLEGKT